MILYCSEGERKKESQGETYKQVAVKRKERKMAIGQIYGVEMIDSHKVNFWFLNFYEWILL